MAGLNALLTRLCRKQKKRRTSSPLFFVQFLIGLDLVKERVLEC